MNKQTKIKELKKEIEWLYSLPFSKWLILKKEEELENLTKK